MNEIEKRMQLIADIERLKAENERLHKEIDVIEEKDERLRGKHRVGHVSACMYWRMPVKFLDTVFYAKKEDLKKENDVCMLKEFDYIISPFPKDETNVMHMAVLCEDIIQTEEGFRLALMDPYKKVLSNPLSISYETATSIKGKIIFVDFTMNSYNENEIFIKRWKSTPYKLREYKGEQIKVENSIVAAAMECKEINNEEEAVKAVTALQNYYRLNEENCKVARISPTEIRMLKDTRSSAGAILYSIRYENGEFWFHEEPDHVYNPESLIYLNKQFLGGRRSDQYVANERWSFKCIKEEVPEVNEELFNNKD